MNGEDLSRRSLDDLLGHLTDPARAASALREEALRRMTPWVRDIAALSFAESGIPEEDLFQAGYLGLLSAVYNADLARGQDFRTYAENLVKGEIRQHIRGVARPSAVPRWLRDLNRQIEAAEARILRRTGRLPTLQEVSQEVNLTEEATAEVLKARDALNYVSLREEERRTDPAPSIDIAKIRSARPDPFPIEDRIRIAAALEKLGELQELLLASLFAPPPA